MNEEDVKNYFSYAGDISGRDNLSVKMGLILDELTFVHNTINNELGNDFLVKIKNVKSDDDKKIDSFLEELKENIHQFMGMNPNYELIMKVELGFKLIE